MENIFSTYILFLNSDKSKLHEILVLKNNNGLDKKDSARFLVGSIQLLSSEHVEDFLLNSDYIKDTIEKSSKENGLHLSMTDEMCEKYVPLLKEKIMNA